MPYERAHVVDLESDSLLVKAGKGVRVLWPFHLLLPPVNTLDLLNNTVAVKLYEIDLASNTEGFRDLATLVPILDLSLC